MRKVGFAVIGMAISACLIVPIAVTSASATDNASPIYGVTIPRGYRQWAMVAPSHEMSLDELRVILGNPEAMKAYEKQVLPFPDGTVLAKLGWKRISLVEGHETIPEAFVPGHTTTVQFMVKNSKRYAATGGWGFGRFIDGKPVDDAQHETCFSCHAAHAKEQDYVFTRYAP